MYYEELQELFDNLTERQKFRLVCRFVLNLPINQIALIENKKRNSITTSIKHAQNTLIKIQSHAEFIAVIQEIFTS